MATEPVDSLGPTPFTCQSIENDDKEYKKISNNNNNNSNNKKGEKKRNEAVDGRPQSMRPVLYFFFGF